MNFLGFIMLIACIINVFAPMLAIVKGSYHGVIANMMCSGFMCAVFADGYLMKIHPLFDGIFTAGINQDSAVQEITLKKSMREKQALAVLPVKSEIIVRSYVKLKRLLVNIPAVCTALTGVYLLIYNNVKASCMIFPLLILAGQMITWLASQRMFVKDKAYSAKNRSMVYVWCTPCSLFLSQLDFNGTMSDSARIMMAVGCFVVSALYIIKHEDYFRRMISSDRETV